MKQIIVISRMGQGGENEFEREFNKYQNPIEANEFNLTILDGQNLDPNEQTAVDKIVMEVKEGSSLIILWHALSFGENSLTEKLPNALLREYSSTHSNYNDKIELIQACIGDANKIESLWEYISGDKYIEASLEFFNVCKNPIGNTDLNTIDNYKLIEPIVEDHKTGLRQSNSFFDTDYQAKLTTLRDALVK